MTDLIKGIDISIVQGKVDFQAVAASGIKFVICRCGVGNSGVDSLYKQNIANARAAGLKVAAYHFIYPLPTIPSQPLRDPKAQAKLHFDDAGDVPVVCCDLEWPEPQDWAKWGCTASQIVQWTIDYLEAYEQMSGIRPIVYTYPNFAKSIQLPDSFGQKYKLWIASYQSGSPFIPKPWTDWVMWQDSGGTQRLPNGGPVDTDKAKDLSLWDPPVVAAATPAPTSEVVVVPETAPAPVVVVPVTPPAAPIVPASKPSFLVLLWQLLVGLYNKYVKKQ